MLKHFSKDVMITQQNENSVTFRTACGCHCDEHDITIDIEFDKKWQLVDMLFYKKISLRSYTHKTYEFRDVIKEVLKFLCFKEGYIDTIDWWLIGFEGRLDQFRDYRNRIRLAVKLLWTGWIEMDEGFTFKGEEHIRNFIRAMDQGLSYVTRGDERETLTDFTCLVGKIVKTSIRSNELDLLLCFTDGSSLSMVSETTENYPIPGMRILDVLKSSETGCIDIIFDYSMKVPAEGLTYKQK